MPEMPHEAGEADDAEQGGPDAGFIDPATAAEEAGLVYVNDEDTPGIARRAAGTGFTYRGPDGRTVKDPATLKRIRSLAIPPAYTEVWICADPNGHIQATGRDARGRKQYRYHPRWREFRDQNKYERMLAFGRALPAIRARVDTDMALRGLPKDKVVATVVRLLEASLIRVGNEEYVKQNKSFGLTTMRDRHVAVSGSEIMFEFKGKSGKHARVKVRDRRLAKIVKSCQDIPGQVLFQFLDDEGQRHSIGSADVNEYLRRVTGQDFTAKDFRTWAGTTLAAFALQEFEQVDTKLATKRNIKQAIERVSAKLGNTPTICRKCYVHPEVIAAYQDGSLLTALRDRVEQDLREDLAGLSGEEAAVLAFLQERLSREIHELAEDETAEGAAQRPAA